MRASFLFLSSQNGCLQLWPGSTTNCHVAVALYFATISGCDQLVICPTHVREGSLDLLMMDVPDLVQGTVVASLGNSDQSSLSTAVSMAQAVPNLCGRFF